MVVQVHINNLNLNLNLGKYLKSKNNNYIT